jgi:hypothetical protein
MFNELMNYVGTHVLFNELPESGVKFVLYEHI